MSTPSLHHNPLIRMAKRDGLPVWKAWGIRALSGVLALLGSGLFFDAVTRLNPVACFCAWLFVGCCR